MAFCRTGTLILKAVKPVLGNPFFIIPSTASVQVRHAARKGYRDKIKKQKKVTETRPAEKVRDFSKLKRKFTKFEKTLNLKKPEPPNDDVIIMDHFNYKKFSLSEAVKLHREYHHPTVFNNPEALVNLRIEINMVKKGNQFIKPFSGVAAIPHHFSFGLKKEILVVCSPEDREMALSCGASVAGHTEIIEKIKEGEIQPSLFEYIVAHVSVLPLLTPIRSKLKEQNPKAKNGTLTNDLKSAILRFLHGIEYSCERYGTGEDFGCISCTIGTIDMELNHLEENLKALIEDIEKNKPTREGEFISWIWCLSPPSNEQFSLDLSLYVESQREKDIFDNDDDVELDNEKSEREVAATLVRDYKDEELMKTKI